MNKTEILITATDKVHQFFSFLTRSTTVAFLIFFLVGLSVVYIVQQDNIEQAARASKVACNRGNEFRKAVNERGDILKQFMLDAATSREKQAKISLSKGNLSEAKVNQATAEGYRRQAHSFTDLLYVDCEASYNAGHTIYQRPELPGDGADKSPVKPKTSTQPAAKSADS